jgi:predicted nucleotidyltransferase
MNKNICKTIIKNKNQFIPHLFTERQVIIMQKYLQKQKLTNTEKTYLYSTIKRKTDALQLLKEEWYIKGNNMIPERVKEAKEILKKLNKKAFISGSFLYTKNYNDIDIFIVGKRRKQRHDGNKHFIYINEKKLRHPIFFSCLLYSVATFSAEKIEPIIKRPDYSGLVTGYEMAINEILDDDDQKMVRDLLFEYHLQIKDEVLDSFSLHKELNTIKRIPKKERIKIVNNMIKEMLLQLYSRRYIHDKLSWFVKQLEKDIQNFKTNDNLIIYHKVLGDVKNECRRAQAAA